MAHCYLCDDDSDYTCGSPTACHPTPITGGPSPGYLILSLHSRGLPISAIAEILDVNRTSIYSFLDGTTEPPAAVHQHLAAVYAVLAGEVPGALRFFHRLWQRKLPDGGTLKAILSSPEVSRDRVAAALDVLRPAVMRGMAADVGRAADTGPVGLLGMWLTTGW